MKIATPLIPLVCLLHLLIGSAFAEPTETRRIRVRFAALNFFDSHRSVKLNNGTLIKLNLRHLSDESSVDIKQNKLVVFSTNNNESPLPLATCQIPEKENRGIVLLIPGESNYRSLFIPHASIPKGGVYIMNYSGEELGINMGGDKAKVEHKKGLTYSPKGDDNHKLEVEMFQHEGSKVWKKVYSSKWVLVKNRREILILTKQKNSNRILSQGITQYGAE